MEETYAFYAFISYRSSDEKWARWLQNKLESYRLPTALSKKNSRLPKRIKPCFRYHTDIQPNELKAELEEKLTQSKYLIVVCSPRSATSKWVGNEIETFIGMGRRSRVIPFIVEGLPYSGNPETECYHPVIHHYFPHSDDVAADRELLGVNINEAGAGSRRMKRRRALIQVISRLLDVSFDELWNRERQRQQRRMLVNAFGVLAVASALVFTWRAALPVDVSLSVAEATTPNASLPPLSDVVVALQLDDEVKADTALARFGNEVCFPDVSSRFLGREVRVSARCSGWLPLDTVVTLRKVLRLEMRRNAQVYGRVCFTLWDAARERPIPHVAMKIHGHAVQTDASGKVQLLIPLAEQRRSYAIEAEVPLEVDSIYMPCGTNDYVLIR